jgi:queuine tRNA-ribosyltransferase
MSFKIESKDPHSSARAGKLELSRGSIETPVFMPVGTVGTVKAVHQRELTKDINAPIILGNTYHLYLRPGMEILEEAGGLHGFMSWERPILTDSGGYQVYSLSQKRKISEEGVHFQSHIDGSRHYFTPERAIEIQRSIGGDIIMAFDECPPYPCDKSYAKDSMHMTHRWLKRCMQQFKETDSKYGHPQTLAPIVQGSTYPDLRKESAKFVADQDAEINAIGGLSVGEPHDKMYSMTAICTNILPEQKARYLMGVGTPDNLLECIERGVDMFDCVLPTRNGRHGLVYTRHGRINIKNKKWENDYSALDEENPCFASRQYSKAYVRHLFSSREYLGAQITSLHNLSFYMWLMQEARDRIKEGNFMHWKEEMVSKLKRRL